MDVLRHFSDIKALKKVMLDVTTSVDFLHQQGIYHWKINPDTIRVFKDKADNWCGHVSVYPKSTDLDFFSPELCTREIKDPYKADVLSLGSSFFFAYTGSNPLVERDNSYTHRYTLNENYESKFLSIGHMKQLYNYEKILLIDLLQSMLMFNPEKRIDISGVIRHPFFWDNSRAFRYFEHRCRQLVTRFHRSDVIDTFKKLKKDFNCHGDSYDFFRFVLDEHPTFFLKLYKYEARGWWHTICNYCKIRRISPNFVRSPSSTLSRAKT
jgi:serine/threonine protein kinase